jgi:hypothetical protein
MFSNIPESFGLATSTKWSMVPFQEGCNYYRNTLEILEILKLPKQIYVKGSFLFPQFVNMNSSVEPLVASGIMMEPLMSSRYHLAVAGNHEMTQTLGG